MPTEKIQLSSYVTPDEHRKTVLPLARAAKLSIANLIRERLGLPILKQGRPRLTPGDAEEGEKASS